MGYVLHSMGLSVHEDSDDHRWRWNAHWDERREDGVEDTWAEALGAAREAFHELEEKPDEPETVEE